MTEYEFECRIWVPAEDGDTGGKKLKAILKNLFDLGTISDFDIVEGPIAEG